MRIRQTYAEALDAFRWETLLSELGWRSGEPVNLGQTIVDRHAAGPKGRQTALLWLGSSGEQRELSYAELSESSSKIARLLVRLGVKRGDRVATFLPRLPETFAVILGIFKTGAVFVPIFTGFGPDGVRYRVEHSGAKLLFTDPRHRAAIPPGLAARVVDIDSDIALAQEPGDFEPVPCRREDPAAIIYTSGSTGQPKGCVIAVNLLAAIWPYLRYGIDLREQDLFWPTGDPAWGYGLCCYLPAFAAGGKVLCVEDNPNAERFLALLARYRVTNLATTPTLLRAVMALGEAAVRATPVPVRAISSCGEPLNSEVVEFFRRVWQATPMDHYGATEFALPIGNYNAVDMEVKAGSMGLPCPGYRMGVVDESGRELEAGKVGLVAQKSSENSRYWLRYWNDEAGSAELMHGGWACTGDLARRDEQGYFWFEGRADDIIKSSGYRIGPFEVESCILKHPAVAEAGVVGKPDAQKGALVKAFVVLKQGVQRSPGLAQEITELVRRDLGRHQYPREIEFVDDLPKTQTGKIQRFLLRQRA